MRRVRGTLNAADETGFTLVDPDLPDGSLRVAYDEVERARTIFEWGPQPKRVRG